ncbi:MAG: fimbrillin family protein [Prevotella sp.]|nr:fimbrillin family protein [Prevotella sp.]
MAHFIYHRFCAGFRYAAVVAASLLISCDDDLESGMYSAQPAFDVHVNSSWNKGNVTTRSESTDINIEKIADSGNDRQLYLVTELETLDTYSAPTDCNAKTRGTTITESNFPSSFGLFAICYDMDSQMNSSMGTVYARNVEIKKHGSGNLWQADGNGLEWIGTGRLLFNAYAPYMPEKSNISYSTTGMPCLNFTVNPEVKDQTDLLTAKADAPGRQDTPVALNFSHALSAITIRTGDAMLAGDISKVIISGVHGSGKLELNTGTWTVSGNADATYTAETEVSLSYDTDKNPYTGSNLNIAGTDDGLTFFMIPQQLEADAKLTIVFTDEISATERTLSAPIGGSGKKWDAGKLYTYSISSTGVIVAPVLEIKKDNASLFTGEKQEIPFTGVMHGLDMTAYLKVFQYDSDNKETNIKNVPADVNVYSSTDGGTTYIKGSWDNDETATQPTDFTKPRRGSLVLQGQSVFNGVHSEYPSTVKGSYQAPIDLSGTYNHPAGHENETANSYIVTDPGYFSFPAIYGNALKNETNNTSAYTVNPSSTPAVSGLSYFVDHNNNKINGPYITDQLGSGEYDAILLWSDSPGLVDKVEYKSSGKGKIQFRIQKSSIADGNAVIALRKKNGNKYDIVWSWHIWVTRSNHCSNPVITRSEEDSGSGNKTEYHLMNSTLGYSPSHGANASRSLKVKFDFGLKGIAGSQIIFDGQQDAIMASVVGDNTYYQWGRKDAMLPGVYEKPFSKPYTYTPNLYEFTMYNKPIYDQYEGYEFCSSVKIGYERGMNIGETIQHPYAFTMGNPTVPVSVEKFRNYWHALRGASYAATDTTLHNAWNSTAYQYGGIYNETDRKYNNQKVTKTIYDPCPPGFNVPNPNAFRGMASQIFKGYYDNRMPDDGSFYWDSDSKCWVASTEYGNQGAKVRIYPTGVRDYCLTAANWPSKPSAFDLNSTWPAFSNVTYIATTALQPNGRCLIFYADNRRKYEIGTGKELPNGYHVCGHSSTSSTSYGFTVWPEFSGTQTPL